MHRDTALVHLGRTSAAAAQAVNPPIVRASTIVFDNLAAYKKAQRGRVFDAPRYGRSGTSTTFEQHGAHAAPDACWMALRGLRTLAVRMARHQDTANTVARWLQARPQVLRVRYPALESDPGHALWRAQFSGAGGPFTIELQPCSEPRFERFIDSLRLFALGTSWGGFESLVMPAIPHAQRGLAVQPDSGRLVRLHVGLEDAQDLCDDLAQALDMMTAE
jgi:cystathionine beta-lyase